MVLWASLSLFNFSFVCGHCKTLFMFQFLIFKLSGAINPCGALSYTHNWSLQPYGQDYILAFSYYLCSIRLFIHMSGKTYSLKSTLQGRFFFRNFSWQLYLFTEFLPEICWEEVADEIFSYFRFDVWPRVWNQNDFKLA